MLGITLLSLLNPFSWFGESIDKDVKIAYKVNARSAKMLKNKYNLYVCGTGIKAHDKVEGLYLYFNYYEPIADINEARIFLYNVCQDHYANIINSEEIKPYLMESFALEDINVTIFFNHKDGKLIYHPGIGTASFFGFSASFTTDDKNNKYKNPADISERRQYFLDIAEGRIPPPVYKELQE